MNHQPNNHGLHPMGNMAPGNQQDLAQMAMYQAYWQQQLAQMGFRPMVDPNALPVQPMIAPPQLMAPQQVVAQQPMMAPAPAPEPARPLVRIKEEFDPEELLVIRDDLNEAQDERNRLLLIEQRALEHAEHTAQLLETRCKRLTHERDAARNRRNIARLERELARGSAQQGADAEQGGRRGRRGAQSRPRSPAVGGAAAPAEQGGRGRRRRGSGDGGRSGGRGEGRGNLSTPRQRNRRAQEADPVAQQIAADRRLAQIQSNRRRTRQSTRFEADMARARALDFVDPLGPLIRPLRNVEPEPVDGIRYEGMEPEEPQIIGNIVETAQSHRGSRSSTSTPSTPSNRALKRRENLAIACREKEEKAAEEKKKKEKQLQARRERGVRHRNPFVQKQQEELDAWNNKKAEEKAEEAARLAADPAPAAAPASAPIDDKPEEDAPMDDGAQEGQQMDN